MSSTTSKYLSYKGSRQLLATISTYKPFIIGLTIVLLATYFMGFMHSSDRVSGIYQTMNDFMGFFFITFAIPKLFSVSAYAKAFQQYDIISGRLPVYARVFPFIELSLGVILLSTLTTSNMPVNLFINAIIAIISGLGVLSVLRALQRKKTMDCACMGTTFKFPLSKVALVENGAMFIMALGMLFLMPSTHMVMAQVGMVI